MSAVVGFIALFGMAVMNGVVHISRTRELNLERSAALAAESSALQRFRPVLKMALVAGAGFLPTALATGLGAEVHRPLSPVVIGGLRAATPLTLRLLPALFARFFGDEDHRRGAPIEGSVGSPSAMRA